MPSDFNQQIIQEFRANRGKVGGPFEGARLLLLTTTGARTGVRHVTPLACLPDGGRTLVIASAGGAPANPAWYHNLLANPRVTVEDGQRTYEAEAAVLEGEERDLLFARAAEADPGWSAYQARAGRVIPVIALTPLDAPHPVNLTHIPATAEESSAVLAEMGAMRTHRPRLPADADLTPVLPDTGGVAGSWVTAPHHPAAETGVTIYVHGGGFQFTDPELEQIMAYRLSRVTGRPVLRVDYRLAPAHRYPAALDDVVAVYRSLLDQNVPASRIILSGESAGGTLVLSALLVLKEAGVPLPHAALAISPQTDLTLSSPSIEANDGEDVVSRAVLDHVATQYLAGARPDQAPQSPLHGRLDGLPPLLLAVGSKEVLLDDARRFAEAVSAAGGTVSLDVYEGMPHAFHATVLSDRPLPVATTLLHRVAEWIGETRQRPTEGPDSALPTGD
ncbi:nitroreductase/quinone reductase family protein [Sphaerisporangium sp. NBC_01403]|uniref:nitroreductase/quinone reductase family protein n=1 Tax=Sphaerisporangium sp. NBC_01403 TaxID=2903599 RepID=UPI0032502B90